VPGVNVGAMTDDVLLHDKVEENGKFIVTAVRETVDQRQIMTPREVFNSMKDGGYLVDYARLPVADQQAPIPGMFSRHEQRDKCASNFFPEQEPTAQLGFNCQMGRGRTTTGHASYEQHTDEQVNQT